MPTHAYALADPERVLEDMASRLGYVRAYTDTLDVIADELTDEQFSLLLSPYEAPRCMH